MIRFIHVSKEYARGGLALDDVSFHIAKGEFAFLTGPSGAGKIDHPQARVHGGVSHRG